MWTLKTAGESFYVNHVECNVPWTTKETPDNEHTKGSIKVKHCLLAIDNNNEAFITVLTDVDKARLRNREKGITRILIDSYDITAVKAAIANSNIKHGPFKSIFGGCGTGFYITDILGDKHLTLLTLSALGLFRKLKENESYYKAYDDPKYKDQSYIDEDELYEEDDEDNE